MGCELNCYCRNSNGEVVRSRLFQDLLHFTKDRATAVNYYGLGTSREFLDKVGDAAVLDENGEITFDSLVSLAQLDIQEDVILNTLNKDIKAGLYGYEEAVAKITNFNRESSFSNKYLATLEREGDKYRVSIIKKDSAALAALSEVIKNETLIDRIKYYLNSVGADATFIDSDNTITNGRYSTENAEKTADGLYQVIRVVRGEKMTETLAEEAGHFIVGSLGNSPLVERLLNYLTPEVQEELAEQYAEGKVLGVNPRRELAGTLIGQALLNNIDQRSPIKTLLDKIINLAKRVFALIKGDEVALSIEKARAVATQLAQGFMSEGFTGTIDEALAQRETLYSQDAPYSKGLHDIVRRLKISAHSLKTMNSPLYDKFLEFIESAEAKSIETAGIFDEISAIEGIADAISNLSDLMLSEIPRLLDEVEINDTMDFYGSMPKYGKNLRTVREYTKAIADITAIADDLSSRYSGNTGLEVTWINNNGMQIPVKLREIAANLQSSVNDNILPGLKTKEYQFFLRFLEDSYGQKFIVRSARAVFKGLKINFTPASKVKIADVLSNLDEDITFFQRWLGSMSNNPDIIGQIMDKIVKQANFEADRLTNLYQEKLLVLQKELEDIGLTNTDKFFERSSRDGQLTGNIISQHNWGDYEADWAEFKAQQHEAFKAATPNIESMSTTEIAVAWHQFFSPVAKQWYKTHSVYDKTTGESVPNSLYDNPEYAKLSTAEIKWLDKYNEIRRQIYSALPEGSIPDYRLPQFKGTFSNRVRNRRLLTTPAKAVGRTIRQDIFDTFCESSEDRDYGSEQTFNSEHDDITNDFLGNQDDKMERVPLFGINKLEDLSELSTDLFHSTLAFASMAFTHAALSQIIDTAEVGKEVLSERVVKRKGLPFGIRERQASTKKGDQSNAYNRYIKYVEKQIYGVGMPKIKIGKHIVINKVVGAMTGFSAKYFLGGNVVGGAVNLLTGFNEVAKEAISGEHFTLQNWKDAHALYFKSLPANLIQDGEFIKNDKVSLLIRHFNILNKNKDDYRQFYTRKSRFQRGSFNPLNSDNLMLPYSSGEHYMQTLPYLATMLATTLYDAHGNKINLFNAYKIVDIEDEAGKTSSGAGSEYGKTLSLNGTFYKGPERINPDLVTKYNLTDATSVINTYRMLNQISSKASNMLVGQFITFTKDEVDFLTTHNYNPADLSLISKDLENEANKLIWTSDDEASFVDTCREIDIRLHGVYNNFDKTVAHQNWLTNAILAMRSYALGMVQRRFGTSTFNVALGHDVEGSLTTAAKLVSYAFTDKQGFALTARMFLLPFGENAKEAMTAAGFSANQYANARRNWGDNLLLLSLAILKMLTGPDRDPEDDEEDDVALGVAHYFSCRAFREQAAFNLPHYMFQEAPNLFDIKPVGFSATLDFSKIMRQALGTPFHDADKEIDERASEFYYQRDDPNGLYQKGDPKWWLKAKKKIPYLRSWYTLASPYDAAQNYEYGRKLRY